MLHRSAVGLLAGMLGLCGPGVDGVGAECAVDGAGGDAPASFRVHLGAGCSESERDARAIDASKLLAALTLGQTIDLSNVVIRGDLILDSMPVSPNPPAIEGIPDEQRSEIRVVDGDISIVNSLVRGAVAHRSTQGLLLFNGRVTFADTRFEQPVDLSRSVFTQAVTLSGAVFLRESYFVQGRFLKDVTSNKTAFGPHTRFHRSHFHGPVTFQQSGFSGLSEFLEVEFDRDADFSRTYFKLGTGFSGSQFKKLADFSEALFDGDAFFTFTRFDGDTFFRRATFRATADFDDAQFNAREDFSKVYFEKGPRFERAKRSTQSPQALGIENPQIQYLITLSLLLFSAVLIAYLMRYR